MSTVTGFPPIANRHAIILILGSMPSIKSLQEQQYYAHPRNSFWPILTTLLAGKTDLDYEQRKSLLLENRIALWDVLNTCQRKGSLDSSIRNETTIVNDFNTFFKDHSGIEAVYFNGALAQQEYRKQVLPKLDKKFASIEQQRLPSTSPAMASLTREQKLRQWKTILKYL
ncbi:MAG: DNA-deoxyinosine glycosylase [Gammaproteobacteria bacterium]|nr:DNA-deoxyinosine glycosylase [Gammaproteobacteria bacterium]